MKKLLTIILTLCMCLSLGMALTACNLGSEEPEHTHTYENVWSYDDTYHWYACGDETCSSTSQKAEHNIVSDTCSICGYEQTDPTPPPAQSANEVTEEEFYAAFAFEDVVSVTIQSESNTNIVNGVQQGVHYATTFLDGNKIKIISNDITTYAEFYDTYVYIYALDATDNTWVRSTVDPENAAGLVTLASLEEMLDGADFSDFSFEDGYYIGSQIFEEGTAYEYVVNFKFQFENGKLISARGEYEVEGFDCYDYMTFTDYNSTTVNVPTEYRENEDEPTPPATSSWASYFEFENVTATKISSTYYADYDMTLTETESIKVDGSEWLWETTDYWYGGTSHSVFVVYFDGLNAYVNGVVDNEFDSQSEMFFFDLDFSMYESSFDEATSGVYTANEINMYGVYSYKNVRITIVDENISTISYEVSLTVGGATYTTQVSCSFSDWNETVVDGEQYTKPSVWASYFDFGNVTINETMQYIVGGTTHYGLDSEWKVDGDAWVCNRVMEKVDGIVTRVNEVYYNGINYYLNGEPVGEEDAYAYHYMTGSILGELVGSERLFQVTNQGTKTIYTATNIMVFDVVMYTDVELVVENGKIVKITYVRDNAASFEGQHYAGTFTLEFSDYDVTIVEGSTEPSHTCSYVREVVSSEYLRTSATCENLATYYYSCECENVGTEWFEYGALADCVYGDWHSNNDGTHSKICSYNNSHILTDNCYGGSATCEHPAICEGCGAEHGEIGQHDYSLEVEDDRFLISHCGEYAEYYKSCACGLRGEEKFFRDAWEICDYGFWISNGDGTHTRTCSRNVSHAETENCSGGNASCIALAICDYCEAKYGEFGTHSFDNNYEFSDTHHWLTCSVTECGEMSEKVYHDFQNGDCVCGKVAPDTALLKFEKFSNSDAYYVSGMTDHSYSGSIVVPAIYQGLPVTAIGYAGFWGAGNLTEVYLPTTIESIGVEAFFGCSGLNNLTIPSSVMEILGNAFYGCSGLQYIDIPDSVTKISTGAFAECTGLEKITLGTGVSEIKTYAFGGCSALKVIDISTNNSTYYAENNCLIHSATKTLVLGCKTSVVPTNDNVTIIGEGAFYGNDGLEQIYIPYNILEIHSSAFKFCENLTTVVLGKGIKLIEEYAFISCGLENVYYEGTRSEWNTIDIVNKKNGVSGANNCLVAIATKYYYSDTEPTENLNLKYWYYGTQGEIVVWGED